MWLRVRTEARPTRADAASGGGTQKAGTMRKRTLGIVGLLFIALFLTACGESGSSGTKAKTTASEGSGKEDCSPIAGDEFVALEDDKNLQTVDNIIPAINADVSTDAMIEALNAVSSALDTDKLIALNQQTDIERKTSPNVAKEFVEAEGLAEGLSGGSGKVVVGHADFSENADAGQHLRRGAQRGRLRRLGQAERHP